MQFLTQGSLLIFARTNGIVDRTGGYFVRNLSCDRLLSAALNAHAQVTLVTKLVWSVAVHELELQSDLAGDSTISTLGKYVLAD